jgi:uncharacterized protein
MATSKHTSSQRGFGSMDEHKQRTIASKGGKSVPAGERSFSRDRGLASHAGSKGGKSVPAGERSFSKDHGLASEAGRKGGKTGGGGHSKGGTHEQHVKAGQQSHKHT